MNVLKVTFILTSGKTIVLTLSDDFDPDLIIKAIQQKEILSLQTQFENVIIKCESVIAVLIRKMKIDTNFDSQKNYQNTSIDND